MGVRVVALVSAYNEADIIEQTTRDLIDQGVEVYLLDNGSTDGTADRVRHLLGAGLLAIEDFPGASAGGPSTFALAGILRRKEQLATAIDADWFINHDADELREAPWAGMTLTEGIALVDRLEWNAVDFAVLNFAPTSGDYRYGDDLRSTFSHFEPGFDCDRLQVRCWKKQPSIDLVSNGGHDVQFTGRRVFPIRFLLRHYPIRSQAHGERKVFVERIPRFDAGERAQGWHVQYAGLQPGHVFVQDPSRLTHYDAQAVRVHLQLHHRDVEAQSETAARMTDRLAAAEGLASTLEERLQDSIRTLAGASEQAAKVPELEERLAVMEAAYAAAMRTVAQAEATASTAVNECARLSEQHVKIDALAQDQARRLDDGAREQHRLREQLTAMYNSASWRWTAPFRFVLGLWRGERR